MSRIGKSPVKLGDAKVEISSEGLVVVKGKLGELSYQLQPGITANIEDNVLHVLRQDDSKSQ